MRQHGLTVDVISQGREPRGSFLPPLPKRWRIAAGCAVALVVVVALTAGGLWLRHDTQVANAAATRTPPPGAPGADGVSIRKPFFASVVCAPSTGACSMRITVFKR